MMMPSIELVPGAGEGEADDTVPAHLPDLPQPGAFQPGFQHRGEPGRFRQRSRKTAVRTDDIEAHERRPENDFQVPAESRPGELQYQSGVVGLPDAFEPAAFQIDFRQNGINLPPVEGHVCYGT